MSPFPPLLPAARTLLTARLWSGTLFLWAPLSGFASHGLDDESTFLEAMPKVLTASRMPQSTLDAPAPVAVIDRETILASGFTEIHELLRLLPGFLVADWPDGSPSVANHGLGDAHGRRVKVMIDGRTVNNPFWGSVYWQDLPIRVDDIDHIEVVRGPHGAAYGANAFEGAINIITRSPLTEARHRVIARYGRDGFRDIGVRLNSPEPNKLDWRITASRRFMENFRSHKGASVESLDRNLMNVQMVYALTPRDELRFQGGLMQGYDHRGYPKGVNFPLHSQRLGEHYLHLAWQRSFSTDSELSVQYYHHARKVSANWPVPLANLRLDVHSALDTQRDDLEIEHTLPFSDTLHLLWGAGLRRDTVRSMRFFNTEETLVGTQWQAFGSLTYKPLPALALNLGGTFERHHYSGPIFSPRLAINYTITPLSSLRVSAGQAYRAPSFMETHAKEGYQHEGKLVRAFYFAGLPLKPEKVSHAELGYTALWPHQNLHLDARVFWERYSRYVDDEVCAMDGSGRFPCPFPAPDHFAPLASPSVFYFMNQGQITARGLEARLDWNKPGFGRVLLAQSVIRLGNVHGIGDGDIQRSAPVSMTSLLLIKELPHRWRASVGYYHQSPMSWLNDGDTLPARYLIDFKLTKGFGSPESENEIAITAQNPGGVYPDFHEHRFWREPRLFLTVKWGL
jgi:iron complex outermembrane recepter protein